MTIEPSKTFYMIANKKAFNKKDLSVLFNDLRESEIFNVKLLTILFFKVFYLRIVR